MSALYRHAPRTPSTPEEQAAKRAEFDRKKAEYQSSPERAAMLAERAKLQAEYENGPAPAMWEALRSQGSRGVEFADLLRFCSAGFEVSVERHRVILDGGPMGPVWRWREHSGEDLIGKQNRIDRRAGR